MPAAVSYPVSRVSRLFGIKNIAAFASIVAFFVLSAASFRRPVQFHTTSVQENANPMFISTSSKSAQAPISCDWVYGLNSVREKNFSQGVQDGIIREIFSHIGITNRHFVEFGFGYFSAENLYAQYNRSGLNTANLYWQGWDGTYFDAIIENEELNVVKAVLTESTIVQHFQQAGIPYEVDYVVHRC